MGKLSVPTPEVIVAMHDVGATAWISGHWVHSARRLAPTRPRMHATAVVTRQRGKSTEGGSRWLTLAGLSIATVASAVCASVPAAESSARRRRGQARGLVALRNALVAGSVASAVVDRTSDRTRTPAWLRRAAAVGAVACGLGALMAHGFARGAVGRR